VCVQPGGPPPCKDSDGDGLCDSWELAGRIPGGALLPDADPERPDIYVHYDYMGWGTPGAACTVDSECTLDGATPNYACHDGYCNHNHKPNPEALRLVVEAFARHGVALHIDPDASEVPHSDVITWARADDKDNGPKAVCAGADVQARVLGGPAVSFFDIKDRFFDARKALAYHYVVFAHYSTCLTDDPYGSVGLCYKCPYDRATPPGTPLSGEAGTSELPGNDFIVSLGARDFDANIRRQVITEAGVFMHELGHNLGLHHDGDQSDPDLAPNYLSVMNNKYVFTGIQEGEAVGSARRKTCSVNSDCLPPNTCFHFAGTPAGTPGQCRRVDYSSSTLNTLSELALDKAAGVSPLSAGLRDIVQFFTWSGGNGLGPASGPVDWDGAGLPGMSCTSDTQCGGGGSLTGKCLASGICEVRVDLNKNQVAEIFKGYNDWDHGSCTTSADCPINGIRATIHETVDPSIDPHEPCVRSRCQTLWYPFQCTQRGRD
jgi:hypothetical protein